MPFNERVMRRMLGVPAIMKVCGGHFDQTTLFKVYYDHVRTSPALLFEYDQLYAEMVDEIVVNDDVIALCRFINTIGWRRFVNALYNIVRNTRIMSGVYEKVEEKVSTLPRKFSDCFIGRHK